MRYLLMLAARCADLQAAAEPSRKLDPQALQRVKEQGVRDHYKARTLFEQVIRLHPKVWETEVIPRRKFHSPALCRMVLDHSHRQVLVDPTYARCLTEAVLSLLEAMWPPTLGPVAAHRDLLALANAQLGNADRLAADWQSAQGHFEVAFGWLLGGTGDLMVHALVHRMYAAFFKDQECFVESWLYLQLAIQDFRALSDDHNTGATLLTKSALQRELGNPRGALTTYYEACRLIDERRAPELAAAAWIQLAAVHCDLGEFEHARSALEGMPSDCEQIRGSCLSYLQWVKGRVAHGLGDSDRALGWLQSATAGFKQNGDLMNVAMVSLAELRVHFDKGDWNTVIRKGHAVHQTLIRLPLSAQAKESLHMLREALNRRAALPDALRLTSTSLRSRGQIPPTLTADPV